MSYSVNKAMLLGNLGKDPEVKYTNSGTAYSKISVATSESYKDKNGDWQTKTEWHNVIVWGQKAEWLADNLAKGDKVFVEGRLQTNKWEGRTGGEQRETVIVADKVIGCGANPNGGSPGQREGKQQQQQAIDDSDIPF